MTTDPREPESEFSLGKPESIEWRRTKAKPVNFRQTSHVLGSLFLRGKFYHKARLRNAK